MRKLKVCDKESFKATAKAAHAKKAKQGSHSPFPMFSHPQGSRAPSHIMVTQEHKHHHYKHPSSPSFICTVQHHMARSVPLVSWSQLSWLCPLPYSLCTPSLLTGAVGWNRKGLEAVQALLSNNREHPCVISTIPCWFENQNPIPYELLWIKQQKKSINDTSKSPLVILKALLYLKAGFKENKFPISSTV